MKIAWLFPGQGAQAVGMAKDVVAASAAARDVFARVDAALGEPLSTLIFDGPEDTLTLTANAQPALVATSCALLAAMRERLPDIARPAFAAGHSLGEYSALVAAGALTLEDAVRVVRARGRAMQDAVAPGVGAMAAVMGLAADRVEEMCRRAAGAEVVSPANFNGGQIVIAGHAGAVVRASELAAAEGGKAITLKVSAPFHCALMAPAARAVEIALGQITVAPPAFPVVANVDAAPHLAAAEIKQLLVKQVDHPVRWDASVRFMREHGVTHALEIGPGKVLAGLCRRIAKDMKVHGVSEMGAIGQVTAFLGA